MDIDVLENPFLASLGMTRSDWREGYAEFRLDLQPELLNRQRVLQGGVVATLLDAACGYAGLYSADPQRP
jgi:acyl-coenzyme A thioesterase PaaI-like protein